MMTDFNGGHEVNICEEVVVRMFCYAGVYCVTLAVKNMLHRMLRDYHLAVRNMLCRMLRECHLAVRNMLNRMLRDYHLAVINILCRVLREYYCWGNTVFATNLS
jgi:hypothetical protein